MFVFQFMHCFEGHHVSTLGEITSNSGGHHVQVENIQLQSLHIFIFYIFKLFNTMIITMQINFGKLILCKTK